MSDHETDLNAMLPRSTLTTAVARAGMRLAFFGWLQLTIMTKQTKATAFRNSHWIVLLDPTWRSGVTWQFGWALCGI